MDLWSPRRLQDLCIDFLAKRTDILWTQRKRPQVCGPKGVEWKDSEVFLNSDLADKLLEGLSYEGNLDDSILSTFTNDHVHLQHVSLFFCTCSITGCELEVLKDHKLISLLISTREFDVDVACEVLKNIGNKSFESLQHLAFWFNYHNVTNATHCDRMWLDDDDFRVKQSVFFETLSRFKCLRSLDVRSTDLTDTSLAILGKSLPHVENLDLSLNSSITDISPLKNCQKTLKSLSLGNLYGLAPESTLATFVTLSGLTFLDMSVCHSENFVILHLRRNAFTANTLLQNPDVLPSLECLDLSCRLVNSEDALRQFLDAHRSLQSLMLCQSEACKFKSLQDYRSRLTVGGSGTLEQYTAAFRYLNRREKHRPNPAGFSRIKKFLIDVFVNLRDKKSFPPCLDDQLAQDQLDSIPTRSSFLRDGQIWDIEVRCLVNIIIMLEKGIITHLEPDTKRRLLHLCHKTLQHSSQFKCSEGDRMVAIALKTARDILQFFGEPVPPHGDQTGTEENMP